MTKGLEEEVDFLARGDLSGAQDVRDRRLAGGVLEACGASEVELGRATAFIADHQEKHGPCTAAAGGRYSFRITPTGLGTVFAVECSCGARADVTDTDSW